MTSLLSLAEQPLWMLFAVFVTAGVVVLACGVKLTRYADRLADVTGIGEAVTGAVFLGALTSLAGSVVSVSAAVQSHPDLAFSNAIGGIVGPTVFLVAADAFWPRANLEHAAPSVPNMISGTVLIALLGVIVLAWTMPPFAVFGVHPVTPLLFVFYVFGARLASNASDAPAWRPRRTDDTAQDEPDEPEGGRGTVLPLLAAVAGLGAATGLAGFVIAETGLAIAEATGVRQGLVGALLTALVTSTPELVTTVAAVRRGALALAVGGVLGGNAFDVLFTAFADLAYRDGSIYHAIGRDQIYLVVLGLLMTTLVVLGLLRRERRGPANIGVEGFALLAIYVGGMMLYVVSFR